YPLPEAQLDRFMFKVQVPFPRHADLEQILQRTIRPNATELPESVADAETVIRMLRVAREVVVAPHLVTYAVRLILATHPNEVSAPPAVRQYLRHGASPRGLQALVAGAQVPARLEDRFKAAREELRAVAVPASPH